MEPTDGPPAILDPEIFRPVLSPAGSLVSRGIRPGESELYYEVLDHARKVDPLVLRRAAEAFLSERQVASRNPATRRLPLSEFPVFVDLYNNVKTPEVYLGRPVLMRGHIRKLVEMPAGENDHGLETLYEAWLFTADSQQHPTVVICSSVPGELLEAVREQKRANRPILINGVVTCGYFFKMYGYPAGDAYRFAPLVLGDSLQWTPPRSSGFDRSLPWALGIGLLVFGTPIGWFVWKSRREDLQRRAREAASVPQTLDWLDGGLSSPEDKCDAAAGDPATGVGDADEETM
tara:strand:- start:1650 stop:2519 length:870 start_codon:yes stop_codon:yes gene_type:complete